MGLYSTGNAKRGDVQYRQRFGHEADVKVTGLTPTANTSGLFSHNHDWPLVKKLIIQSLQLGLPERLKRAIFHLGYHLTPSAFEKFAYEYALAPHMTFGLMALAQRGFMPATIVDIGAFQGEWSRGVNQIWPNSRIVMVEPNVASHPDLARFAKEINAELIGELLGAEDGLSVPFNVMGSGSSIMPERSGVPRRTEPRRLRTLDSLLRNVKAPGLLKIDAQGYELQILKGAVQVLPSFEIVLLEVAIIEINEGAPLLDEVVLFMKGRGFVAYDILQIHRRPLDGALNQVDIAFVRETSKLIVDKRHYA